MRPCRGLPLRICALEVSPVVVEALLLRRWLQVDFSDKSSSTGRQTRFGDGEVRESWGLISSCLVCVVHLEIFGTRSVGRNELVWTGDIYAA